MSNSCFKKADILLPKKDYESWAVIACDQYTSEPEYWERARECAGEKPSALNIILPEVYLEGDNEGFVERINENMKQYIENGVFEEYKDALIYVERVQSDGILRRGIVGKIDLEHYDYRAGSTALVRATEQTVLERIPPRVEIRKNAPLELPHVMVLFDDIEDKVMSLVAERREGFKKLYDFELMCGGGHITGYLVDDATADEVLLLLDTLKGDDNLLFCVGDGNHSLATAKECYNLNKTEKSRYALAEIVNIHEDALQFEPIYRVVFGAQPETLIADFVEACGDYNGADAHKYTCVWGDTRCEISVKPTSKLAVGTLQTFLDDYLKANPSLKIDYIHGVESLEKLASGENAVGFLFDGMQKGELFEAVALDGSLPRKTFSMGHADDKRFYIEARHIK